MSSYRLAIVIACLVIAGTRDGMGEVENLIRNGDFEQVASNRIHTEALHWKMGDPDEHGDYWGSASRENWRALEGEFIGTVRGLWAARGTFGGWWQETKAEPGTAYRFSGWFYCDPEWVAQTQEIKIEFWSEDRRNLLGEERRPIEDCDMEWKELSVEAVAPENAVWVRIVVNVHNTGASGALQLDNLSLIRIDEPAS